jgi:hypothetical protein
MEVFIELSDIQSPLQKIFVRVILPPDLRKMCGTVAARPALRNHFWERMTPSPHLEIIFRCG